MPQYISTDPNAGNSRYLSTDPNAGEMKPMASHERSVPATPFAVSGIALGKAATHPGIVAGVGKAAGVVGDIGSSPLVKMVTNSSIPKAAAMVEKAAAPAGSRLSSILDASGKAIEVATKGGPLMRGAGILSRILGKVSLPLTAATTAYDSYNMINSLAERQADPSVDQFEREAILRALSGAYVN